MAKEYDYLIVGDGMEPYYGVNDEKNMLLYQRGLADQETNLILGGHLAE